MLRLVLVVARLATLPRLASLARSVAAPLARCKLRGSHFVTFLGACDATQRHARHVVQRWDTCAIETNVSISGALSLMTIIMTI